MREVSDYSNLKAFWKLVTAQETEAAGKVKEGFDKLMERVPSQQEASELLDFLFIDSHARIRKARPELESKLPLKHYTKNQLKLVKASWWLDHFTCGLNPYSTISTFVSQKVSTHFIQDFTGKPLYVVPLVHGTWHEPHRNKDSVSIEVVNPGKLELKGDSWYFWAGKVPQTLVQALHPVTLATPYRGVKAMLPFSKDQLTYSLALKRLVIAAYPDRFELERMSQHMDWREDKSDMGPLWPLHEINSAAFESIPIPEYHFLQNYENDALDGILFNTPDVKENPQYVKEKDTTVVWDISKVQEFLIRFFNASIHADGVFGPKTKAAVLGFQMDYDRKKKLTEQDPKFLRADGIPGPKTIRAMQEVRDGN